LRVRGRKETPRALSLWRKSLHASCHREVGRGSSESRGFVVKYFPKIGTLLVSRSERWESKERSGASRTYDRAFSSSPDDVRDALTDDRRDSALIDNASRILALCRAICL
jgi:hypothetical protein